jgi:CBS domain-containing protein
MECPHCGNQFILGDDACEHCGEDLTQVDLPKPKSGRLHEMILNDPISQLNAPEPILLETTDTVAKAVRLMKKLRFGSVLVVEGGLLAGIFTERDLVKNFAGTERDLTTVVLGDVMTREPQSLHAEDTIAHALNSMAVWECRHIPVVADDKPRGFVSIRGIINYIATNAL